jgi:hypothetical protein
VCLAVSIDALIAEAEEKHPALSDVREGRDSTTTALEKSEKKEAV